MDERLLKDALKEIVAAEGFRAKPYQDTLGVWTIGHGLTFLTEDESLIVTEMKIEKILHDIHYRIPFFRRLPYPIRLVLLNMSYQM